MFTGRRPSGQRDAAVLDEGAALAARAEAVVLELQDHHAAEVVVEERDVDVARDRRRPCA